MPSDESDRIEDLKQSLYSRNAPDVRTRRRDRTFERTTDVKTDWEHPPEPSDEPVALNAEYEDHRMSFSTKFLIGSVIFCLLAVGAGGYLFWNGANLISANNIDIAVSGPVSIPGGTPVSLTIKISNKNNVVLKGADLSVKFPAGTTKPDDTTASLDTYEEVIGDIAPGASVERTVRAVIFGEQNLQKQVTATLVYGVAGSTSVFTKEQSYDLLVSSSPVVLTVSAFKETTSGQPFDTTVTVKSNSENTLKNVLLKAAYPFGYAFTSSSPKPSSADNATWALGDIPPGGSRTVALHGVLTGEDSDLRSFHFTAGVQSPNNPAIIGTTLSAAQNDVTIQKPFISVVVGVNSDYGTDDFIGQFGRSQTVTLKWANNLPETLSNVTITAHLSGSAYDKNRVAAPGGYFRSATDDVVWNQQTTPELASVGAGEGGTVSFTIVPVDPSQSRGASTNPLITVAAGVAGNRTSSSNVPETTSQVTRNIKVSSNLSLSGRVLRNQGPFLNTGPIPPRAEEKSTYTIVWTVDNTSSSVHDAVVTASLPPYVSWLKQINPTDADISYDTNSGTITWNVGSVNTYTTGTAARREVSFQVAVTPSVDQVGQAPVIMNKAVVSATDDWTGAALTSTQAYLTTSFSTDPSFRNGDEAVQGK